MKTITGLLDLCENSFQRVLMLTALFVFAYSAGMTVALLCSI